MARTLSGEPVVPGMIPGGVASKRPFCSYQVTVFLFIPGVSIHTSGLAVASASMACTVLSSGCGGVYAAGVWSEMAGGSPAGRSLQFPIP